MKRLGVIRGMVLLGPAVAWLAFPGQGTGQEAETGWKDVAELTFVMTGGNATSSTFGFKNTTDYLWTTTSLQVSAGGVRTRSGTVTRTATGTPDDFRVTESTETRTTAESFFVKSRLDRKLSETGFLFAGAGWDRNTFAGVDNRYGFVAGGGRTWFSEEAKHLKTDLGLTYTIQDDVVEDPDTEDGFIGLRGSFDYLRSLTENTRFTSLLSADENLMETSDFRMDWTNSLAVAMSDRFALKTSLQVLFDNSPAMVSVPLGDGEVLTPLGKVDTVFSVALVGSF